MREREGRVKCEKKRWAIGGERGESKMGERKKWRREERLK